MSKAVVVIDLQKCFLPGGSLATANSRNSKLPASTLGKSIAKFINNQAPGHVFVSKDSHTLEHTSFISNANRALGKTNYPSAAKIRKPTNGIAAGRYAGRLMGNPRYWGTDAERFDQKLWPEHCVQGSDSVNVDPSFTDALNETNKAKAVTILKGDTADIDSYSVIADALGNFTPHDESGKPFIKILEESTITEIYITGIARDVCVFWSALDILNYWILPAYKLDKVIKLVFMYDLTRPVSPDPGAPYTDKTKEQIEDEVKVLIKNMGLGPDVYDKVFEVRNGGYMEGGRRKRATRNMRATRKMRNTKKVTRAKNRSLMTNKNCNCGKNHMKRRQC